MAIQVRSAMGGRDLLLYFSSKFSFIDVEATAAALVAAWRQALRAWSGPGRTLSELAVWPELIGTGVPCCRVWSATVSAVEAVPSRVAAVPLTCVEFLVAAVMWTSWRYLRRDDDGGFVTVVVQVAGGEDWMARLWP